MYGMFFIRKLIACSILTSLLAFPVMGCGSAKEMPPTPKAASTELVPPTWQQKWDKTISAAKQEGKLTIYGEIAPKLREALSAFERKYGITMEFVIGGGSEIVRKWATENTAGLNIVDAFHIGSGSTLTMKPLGGVVPIEPYFILPEASDSKLWLNGRLPFGDADKTMLVLTSPYTSYVTVNTELIKEGQLRSYRDLLKPEWKGKAVLFDPTIPSAALGFVVFLMKDIYGLEGTKQYFRQFAAATPAITRDTNQQIEWVARGKYPIGVGIGHAKTSDYKARGAPVTINRFVEGGSINAGSAVVEVPPAPPHPNATALYINWLLTEEGQSAFAKGSGNPPVRIGVKIEGIDPAKVPLPGEKVFLYGEEHTKFGPEAINIVKEVLGDLLK